MKTRLIPFNIEKAKQGAKVVTRNGYPVRLGLFDLKGKHSFPITGAIEKDGKEDVQFFTAEGKFSTIFDESDLDLFIEEEVEETDDYNPYKETVKSISDMIERYADEDSDLQDFYDNVKVKCREAVEYDKKWCKTQEENEAVTKIEPKFKVGDVMRTLEEANDDITEGLPVVISIDDDYYHCNNETIAIKDQDEYEYPPMNAKQKEVKTRRMTHQELADWLRDAPEEHREFMFTDGYGRVYPYCEYLSSKADAPVENRLIRRNHGDWEEPLVEI